MSRDPWSHEVEEFLSELAGHWITSVVIVILSIQLIVIVIVIGIVILPIQRIVLVFV